MKIHLSITHINMKKLIFSLTVSFITFLSFAQDIPKETTKKKDWSKVKLVGRANDHFMLQYGITNWAGKPDSIKTGGHYSRSFNFYIMIDMPFKTDPRFSVGFGPGIGTDHIFFDKTTITTTNHLKPLVFQNLADTNHFDKYKLSNIFLELPLELRFCLNPENSKSFKVALGAKVGVQVDAHTKGKRWVNKSGSLITGFDDKYVQKNKDKYFFNGNRLVGMLRVGYGNISLYGSYQLGSLIKEGLGPSVKPYSIGLTISGL